MNAVIFIRTFARDAEFLGYALQSVHKYATGHTRVLVTSPQASRAAIEPVAHKHKCDYLSCPQLHENDYVGQQMTKLFADNFCAEDYIIHIDSDTLFTRPFTPADYIRADGKTVLLKTRYDKIQTPWRASTEKLLGCAVEWEYMRAFPLVYPRWIYRKVRERLAEVSGLSFISTMAGLKEVSEFNLLGAWADHAYPDKFEVHDTEANTFPQRYMHQFWSWGGFTDEVKNKVNEILK